MMSIILKLLIFASLTVLTAFNFMFWLACLLVMIPLGMWLAVPFLFGGMGLTSIALVCAIAAFSDCAKEE